MKKRLFSILVILLVIVIPLSESKLLEKQTTELLDIQLININLIDNKLVFTIYNNNNIDIKLRFKLDNNLIYNDVILKSYTSQSYNLDYNKQSKLEITPYTIKDNNIILYSLSTITYNLNNLESITSTSASTSITEVTTSDIAISNTRTSYIYSNGHRTASITSDGISYYHDDILGSTRLITDNNNLVIASYDYYPFGSDLKSSSDNNKKYTGKELDSSSNLYYYNARYYNPNNGRFISVDPIFDPTESGYSYVNNNPIIANDPSGNSRNIITNALMFISGLGYMQEQGELKNREYYYQNSMLARYVPYEDQQAIEGLAIGFSGGIRTIWVNRFNRIVSEGTSGATKVVLKGSEEGIVDVLKKFEGGREFHMQQAGEFISLEKQEIMSGYLSKFKTIPLGELSIGGITEESYLALNKFVSELPKKTTPSQGTSYVKIGGRMKRAPSNLEDLDQYMALTNSEKSAMQQLLDILYMKKQKVPLIYGKRSGHVALPQLQDLYGYGSKYRSHGPIGVFNKLRYWMERKGVTPEDLHLK